MSLTTSSYNDAVSCLRDQVLAIKDDSGADIFRATGYVDYATTLVKVKSQANYPLFIIEEAEQEVLEREGRIASRITFNCWMIFNGGADGTFNITFNRIISKFRKEFVETYNEVFAITDITRSGVPKQLQTDLDQFKPFYTVNLTIEYTSIKY